jgi:L-arabonate dehydrase
MVSEEEIARRISLWQPSHVVVNRGYVQIYQQHVQQAHLGADMDFLKGGSGSKVTRDSH